MKKLSFFTVALLFSTGGGGVYAQGTFVHPGLLHSQNDIDQIKERLAANDTETLKAFEVLKNSWVANKGVNDIWGVTEYIKRGIAGDENYMNAYRNAAKAYQCALLWKITGETTVGRTGCLCVEPVCSDYQRNRWEYKPVLGARLYRLPISECGRVDA